MLVDGVYITFSLLASPLTFPIAKSFTDDKRNIIAGYASVEVIDTQNELIPIPVLKEAWEQFKKNKDFYFGSLMHSNIPVIKILDVYTDSEGQVWKSGVDENGLFIVAEVRQDIQKGKQTWELIQGGKLTGFSIGGEALASSTECKGKCYTRVEKMELHEIAVVDRPANQPSVFSIVKRRSDKGMELVEDINIKFIEKEIVIVDGKEGVWKTVGEEEIFIATGEHLNYALALKGTFPKYTDAVDKKGTKYQIQKEGNEYFIVGKVKGGAVGIIGKKGKRITFKSEKKALKWLASQEGIIARKISRKIDVEKNKAINLGGVLAKSVNKLDKGLELLKRPLNKPFAGYKDFKDCERQNQQARDPAVYCATIQETTEKLDERERKKPPKDGKPPKKPPKKPRGVVGGRGELGITHKNYCPCPVDHTINSLSWEKMDKAISRLFPKRE